MRHLPRSPSSILRPSLPLRLIPTLAMLLLLLAACQGGSVLRNGTGGGAAGARGTRGGGEVQLTDADLAQVDRWLKPSNSQWILGDTVDVYASREYFSQVLTMNAKVGVVHRKDSKVDGDELVTMTYIGPPGSASVLSNPRVLVGTGLTITARKTLRVRMAKTRNSKVPVQLRVVARGKASRGRKEKVLERGAQLELGGALRRNQGRWRWATRGGI
jgi:hypothetical protein